MRHFPATPWKARRQARKAHRSLNWLAPNVFGTLVEPKKPAPGIMNELRSLALSGFNGEWPVIKLGGEVIALVPGLSSTLGAQTAVPGVDHAGHVSFLVFGVGQTPFLSHCAHPEEAIEQALRLRPRESNEIVLEPDIEPAIAV